MPMLRAVAAHAATALRFDGLWWRKFANLGCVYGPEWWKRGSPPVIAAIVFLLVSRTRKGAVANLERVLGDRDRRRTRRAALRMFAEFARCVTDTMEYYGPYPRPIRLDLPEHDVLASALRAGRGAVLVTGHVGNWDVAAKALRDYARPVNLVMAREANSTVQEYVRTMRERSGVRVIYSDTSVFSALNMIRALRDNEVVAIQLDRMLGLGGARAVSFFGTPTLFPSGPFILARLAGAPIIPTFIPRIGRRHYAVRIGPATHLRREARDAAALDRAMRTVAGQFEAVIREFPTQWFQFAPFWVDTAAVPSQAERHVAAAAVVSARGDHAVGAGELRRREGS